MWIESFGRSSYRGLMNIALSAAVLLVTALAATAKPAEEFHESPEVVVKGLGFVARVQAVWKMSATQTPLTIQLAMTNHSRKEIQFSLFDTISILIEDIKGRRVDVGFLRTWTTWPHPIVIGPGQRTVLDEPQAFLVNVPPQEFIMTDATSGRFQSAALGPGTYKLAFAVGYPPHPQTPSHELVLGVSIWSGQTATAMTSFRIVRHD